jgi:hypothetical protein
MPSATPRRFWRRLRVGFRWTRIVVWMAVLALVCGAVYLNQVGLPDFLKQRLVAALHARGLDFEFEAMRVEFDGGIVADRVRFVPVADPAGPRFTAEQVVLQLNGQALKQLVLEPDSLDIRKGRFVLPLPDSNAPPRELVVENIASRVTLFPGDVWQLSQFEAQLAGARVRFFGTLSNATAMQTWDFGGSTNRNRRVWQRWLRNGLRALEETTFHALPEIRGYWLADARQPAGIRARLDLRAAALAAPQVNARELALTTWTVPATNTGGLLGAQLQLDVREVETPWARAGTLRLRAETTPNLLPDAWPGLDVTAEIEGAQFPWGEAEHARVAVLTPELRRHMADYEAHIQVTLREPRTPWGRAHEAAFAGHLDQLAGDALPALDAAWGFWTNLAPYELDGRLNLLDIEAQGLKVDRLETAVRWRVPELQLPGLEAALFGGRLQAEPRLNITNRHLAAAVQTEFDVMRLQPVLKTNTQRWLGQYAWDLPPRFTGAAGLTLPAWTNRQPDWGEVGRGAWVDGWLVCGSGAFRTVPFSAASSHVLISNGFTRLPDLRVLRPEGALDLTLEENSRTRDYHWTVRSGIDVKALRPLLDEGGQRALDSMTFSEPPRIEGEIWGRWRARELTGFRADVAVTNFVLRNEPYSAASAALAFTNQNVQFRQARVLRPEGMVTVESGSFDVPTQRLHLTNGLSTVEPGAITRPIGPKTHAAIAPYQFARPPVVRGQGVIPVRDISQADMTFNLEGESFRWLNFNLPRLAGDLRWLGDQLILTNIVGGFYDGHARGHAWFNFAPPEGTRFAFDAFVADAKLNKFMADITGKPGKLEGLFTGHLSVTNAVTWDGKSWQGSGHAALKDGLIWDTPIFGLFSAPLNAIVPGLGNSRAREASATFVITNSVIHTRDLEILAGMARLHYDGTVDFNLGVNARVEAELLRDTFVVGRLLSLALTPFTKLFEFKVSGTLAQPRSEPLFIPKVLMMPLRPWQTLKELFGEDEKPPATPTTPTTAPPDGGTAPRP